MRSLTPEEIDVVQLHFLRRWLAVKRPRCVRRKTDNREGLRNNGTRWGYIPAKKPA